MSIKLHPKPPSISRRSGYRCASPPFSTRQTRRADRVDERRLSAIGFRAVPLPRWRSLDRFANLKTSTVPLQRIARCGYYAHNRRLEALIMICFMFLVLERHRVVAPTSTRPLAAPVPAL
jgi:hypothetical protein